MRLGNASGGYRRCRGADCNTAKDQNVRLPHISPKPDGPLSAPKWDLNERPLLALSSGHLDVRFGVVSCRSAFGNRPPAQPMSGMGWKADIKNWSVMLIALPVR